MFRGVPSSAFKVSCLLPAASSWRRRCAASVGSRSCGGLLWPPAALSSLTRSQTLGPIMPGHSVPHLPGYRHCGARAERPNNAATATAAPPRSLADEWPRRDVVRRRWRRLRVGVAVDSCAVRKRRRWVRRWSAPRRPYKEAACPRSVQCCPPTRRCTRRGGCDSATARIGPAVNLERAIRFASMPSSCDEIAEGRPAPPGHVRSRRGGRRQIGESRHHRRHELFGFLRPSASFPAPSGRSAPPTRADNRARPENRPICASGTRADRRRWSINPRAVAARYITGVSIGPGAEKPSATGAGRWR